MIPSSITVISSEEETMTITLTFAISVESGLRSEPQLDRLVCHKPQETTEAPHEGLPTRPVWRQLLWPWAREYDQPQ